MDEVDVGFKRSRSVNFTREETLRLVHLVESRITVIESKQNDAITWQDKEKTWKAIETDFNNCSSEEVYREARHLKSKYEALKRDIRKKSSLIRARRKEGCSPNSIPCLTPLERKVKEMIVLNEGDESASDAEHLHHNGTEQVYIKDLNNSNDTSNDEEPLSNKVNNINKIPQKKHSEWVCLPPIHSELNFKTSENSNDEETVSDIFIKETSEQNQDTWVHLKTEKHPEIDKPQDKWHKPKKKIHKGPKEKLQCVQNISLQKRLLEEDLQQKLIQKKMCKEELEHRRQMHQLEKEEMLLKIELLKVELEKAKQK